MSKFYLVKQWKQCVCANLSNKTAAWASSWTRTWPTLTWAVATTKRPFRSSSSTSRSGKAPKYFLWRAFSSLPPSLLSPLTSRRLDYQYIGRENLNNDQDWGWCWYLMEHFTQLMKKRGRFLGILPPKTQVTRTRYISEEQSIIKSTDKYWRIWLRNFGKQGEVLKVYLKRSSCGKAAREGGEFWY